MAEHKFQKLEPPEGSRLISAKCAVCNEPVGSAETEQKLIELFDVHTKKEDLKNHWNG